MILWVYLAKDDLESIIMLLLLLLRWCIFRLQTVLKVPYVSLLGACPLMSVHADTVELGGIVEEQIF